MKHKQLSPTVVIRSEDELRIAEGDPLWADFMAWVEEGNCAFPPDPPVGDALASIVEGE